MEDGEGVNAAIVGYKIEFKKSDDTKWTELSTVLIGDLQDGNGGDDYFTTTHGGADVLSRGTTYEYRVRAYNNADNDSNLGESPDDDGAEDGQVEENGTWSNTESSNHQRNCT